MTSILKITYIVKNNSIISSVPICPLLKNPVFLCTFLHHFFMSSCCNSRIDAHFMPFSISQLQNQFWSGSARTTGCVHLLLLFRPHVQIICAGIRRNVKLLQRFQIHFASIFTFLKRPGFVSHLKRALQTSCFPRRTSKIAGGLGCVENSIQFCEVSHNFMRGSSWRAPNSPKTRRAVVFMQPRVPPPLRRPQIQSRDFIQPTVLMTTAHFARLWPLFFECDVCLRLHVCVQQLTLDATTQDVFLGARRHTAPGGNTPGRL